MNLKIYPDIDISIAHSTEVAGTPKAEGSSVRVLHILEATRGGTRQYMQDMLSANPSGEFGLVYAMERADEVWFETLNSARSSGWKLWEIPMSRSVRPLEDFRAAIRLREIVTSFNPDVVHCHSSKAGAIGRLAVATLLNRPTVLYSPHALATRINRVYEYIERFLKLFTDVYVAVSPSEANDIASYGLAPIEKIAIVSPAISQVVWSPINQDEARRQLGFTSGKRAVGAIGRLTAQKDPLSFIRLLALLRRNGNDIEGHWIGDGELRGEFLAAARAHGVESYLHLHGWASDVAIRVAALDIVVSLSRYESFGYCVPEALAMHRPVVAANVTGICDILDGELAKNLFVLDDLPSAVSRIEELFNSPLEYARVVELGSKKVATTYTLAAMKERLEVLYASVVKRTARTASTL